MKKFIWVFTEEARDKLLQDNYILIKSDLKNNIFIFENKKEMSFALSSVSYILSDTLTF